jgi:SAM-dependent methyltransferase
MGSSGEASHPDRRLVDLRHLRAVRLFEINLVKSWFRPGIRVLEIGGGSGFQAGILASWGCDVTSIDLAATSATAKEYPVEPYDGEHIPFPDHTFDVVFSSNVLEHVPHLTTILDEISRVLKKDGRAIHILPSTAWRFWTSWTHFIHLAKRAVGRHLSQSAGHVTGDLRNSDGSGGRELLLRRMLLDGPHGAYPNEFYELYAFSRPRWRHVFARQGFELTDCFKSRLFYTGYAVLPWLSMRWRSKLSRSLGSATWIYVMRPKARH